MGSCLTFNFVQCRVNRLRAFYKSKGLKSELIKLENGSTLHCWVPTHREARERGRRRQSEAPRSWPLIEKPALVLIHGFGGDGLVGWDNQIADFTKNYRVFVPDLLFFGKSSTKNPQRTEIFQADCINEMLTLLNVQETHLVGTSYGAFVAFWVAYKYPQMCRKVVLCSTGICMTPRTNDPILREYNLTSIDEILLPTTVDGLRLAFSFLYAKRPPALPDFMVQQIVDLFYSRDDRHHRKELLKALVIGSERCPPLPQIVQEVLIVWGREDKVFKLPLAYQLQQHLGAKYAQVAVIEGAGHMPQVEKAKEYNTVILNFLDDFVSEDSFKYE